MDTRYYTTTSVFGHIGYRLEIKTIGSYTQVCSCIIQFSGQLYLTKECCLLSIESQWYRRCFQDKLYFPAAYS